jgi:dolichol-phosphate mannosyltransferase
VSTAAAALALETSAIGASATSPPLAAERRDAGAACLSVIVPTFNESGSIEELLRRIECCLEGVHWEILVVDDNSPDGTATLVQLLGQHDQRIHCLKRVGRRGLSSACLEGMALATGRYLAVIDADLQHDETLLPAMLRVMMSENHDVVVGSRYLDGGSIASWSCGRRVMSSAATWLTCALLDVGLTDPMSGFFMLRREVLTRAAGSLTDSGFKVLLDLVASSPAPLRTMELPYRFSPRRHGSSKLDGRVLWAFALLLMRQLWGRSFGGFVRFCVIGASGVLVHFAVLDCAQSLLACSFALSQTLAVLVSMTGNFALNNMLTFASTRLRGKAFFTGLCRFGLLCAFGAVVNVTVADAMMHTSGMRLCAAAGGILAGALCNYTATSVLVWRRGPGAQP